MRNPVAWAALGILVAGLGAITIIYRVTQPTGIRGDVAKQQAALPAAPFQSALPAASVLAPEAPPPPAPVSAAPIVVPAGPQSPPGLPSLPPAVIQGPSAIPLSEDADERAAELLEVQRQRFGNAMGDLNRRGAARLQRQRDNAAAAKRP